MQVGEWLKPADCKSVSFGIRWFESILAHQTSKTMFYTITVQYETTSRPAQIMTSYEHLFDVTKGLETSTFVRNYKVADSDGPIEDSQKIWGFKRDKWVKDFA